MAYCVSGVVFYLKSTLASLELPVRDRYGNQQNRDFRPLLLSFFSQTTYSSTDRSVGMTSLYQVHLKSPFVIRVAVNIAQV